MGINSDLLLWIESYLKNRQISVAFNGHHSQPFTPTSGVPQGSVLGPLLFNLFINDLSHILENYHQLFADDLKIYRTVKSVIDTIELQKDLDRLYKWTLENKLGLNIDKCCTISFSNKTVPTPAIYNINNIQLSEVNTVKDLGVTFDTKLKFDAHINSIVKKSYSMLGFVMRTSSNFNDASCIQYLYNALVRSRLEYNTVVWNPYQITYKHKIEKVQKKFTRFMFFKFQHEPKPYPQRLNTLKMMELELRREYFDICLLYDIIHDTNMVSNNRPIFRVSRFSSRHHQLFNPHTSRNDYGLHRDPVMRTQLLFNNKFSNIDIINLRREQFKNTVKEKINQI